MQAVFFKAMYWPLGNCSRANSRYSHCFCIHSSRIISIVQKISFSQARTKLYILFRTERSKTILCLAAHARRGHIREYFPPPPRRNTCRKGLLIGSGIRSMTPRACQGHSPNDSNTVCTFSQHYVCTPFISTPSGMYLFTCSFSVANVPTTLLCLLFHTMHVFTISHCSVCRDMQRRLWDR